MRREIPQKVDAQFNFADWSRSTSAVRFGATLFRRTRSASVLSITLTATALGIALPQQQAAAHLALTPPTLSTLSTLPLANSASYLAPQREAQPLAADGKELVLTSPTQTTVWQVQEASDPQSPSAFSTTPNVLTALDPSMPSQSGFVGVKPEAIATTGQTLDIAAAVVAPGSDIALPTASTETLEDKVILNPGGVLLNNVGTLVHTVEKGENLTEIAVKYSVSPDLIAQTNRIPNPNVIDVNEDLVIPSSSALFAAPNPVMTAALAQKVSSREQPATSIAAVPLRSGNEQNAMGSFPDVPQVARRSIFPQVPPLELPSLMSPEPFLPSMLKNGVQRFIWPANGVFTSGYGWRWGRMHRGIDIAAPVGTPIVASASGIVITAGWNDGGFGNLVEIRHPDGTVTRYAHNQIISTRVGSVVNQGEMIAQMGSTGRSTGPHSHFEIHPGGRGAIDPMFLLSRK